MTLFTPDYGINEGFDYTISTAPTSELLTVTDIEDRMDLSDNDDPDVINNQIKAVRTYLESKLNMALVAQKTITAYWEKFGKTIPLPFPPVTSVTSVTVVNKSSGTETALTEGTDYWVEGVNKKKIKFISDYWNYCYGVKIVYVVGLTDPGMVKLVKDAMKSEIITWYLNRGNMDETQYVLGSMAMQKLAIFMDI